MNLIDHHLDNQVNPKPTKVLPLRAWKVSYQVDNSKANIFKLYDRGAGNAYKFRTQTDFEARRWVTVIDQMAKNLVAVSQTPPVDYGFLI